MAHPLGHREAAPELCHESYAVRGTIQKHRLDSTPCGLLLGHTFSFSCVPFSGHMCFLCVPIPGHRCFPLRTWDYALLALQTGVADVSATVFLAGWDCSQRLSSECGDMLLTTADSPLRFGLNPAAATTKLRRGPQWDPDPRAEYCGLTVSQFDKAICAMMRHCSTCLL